MYVCMYVCMRVHNQCTLTTLATRAILEFTKMAGGRNKYLHMYVCVYAQKGVLEKAHFFNAKYVHVNEVQQPHPGKQSECRKQLHEDKGLQLQFTRHPCLAFKDKALPPGTS